MPLVHRPGRSDRTSLPADSPPRMISLYVLAGGMLGSVLGFLRFNRHPARVFMGDTGSLPLGALLGFMALAKSGAFTPPPTGVTVNGTVSPGQCVPVPWRKSRRPPCRNRSRPSSAASTPWASPNQPFSCTDATTTKSLFNSPAKATPHAAKGVASPRWARRADRAGRLR